MIIINIHTYKHIFKYTLKLRNPNIPFLTYSLLHWENKTRY